MNKQTIRRELNYKGYNIEIYGKTWGIEPFSFCFWNDDKRVKLGFWKEDLKQADKVAKRFIDLYLSGRYQNFFEVWERMTRKLGRRGKK